MRLFIALDLDPRARQAAAEAALGLKGAGADVKWVRPELLHFTLKFLGEVEPGLTPDVEDALTQALAGVAAFRLCLAGAGALPSLKRPQVVWLGLAGEVERVAALAAEMDKRLLPLGFAPEGRGFKAHLTLGRMRGKRGKGQAPTAGLTRTLAAMTDWAGPDFLGDRVMLVKSTLTPKGPIYETLAEFTLIPD